MRIMVAGPGAIGSLFAYRLASVGSDVVLLDHNAERAERLTRQGIQIQTEGRTEIFRVPVLCFSDNHPHLSSPPVDLVLLCVKSYDTARAALDIHPVCHEETVIVSLQNGMGNDHILARTYPVERLLCASTGTGGTRIDDGVIRQAGRGPLALAPSDGVWTAGKTAVADLMRAAGETVNCCDDAAALIWSKAVLNAAINPATVLFDVPNGKLLSDPGAHALMLAAAREGQAIASALNVSLLYPDAVEEVEAVCRRTADNISSMLQDHRAGRRTEIDAISGAIVQQAAAAGIDAPVNEDLVRRIRSLRPEKQTQ